MKKRMNQSTLTLILNGASIFALCIVIIFLFFQVRVSQKLNDANLDRFNLTYSANQFMNASSFLTNEVRAYAATGNQEYYDAYQDELNTQKNREAGIAVMQEIGITEEEQAMIDQMSEISDSLVPLEEGAMRKVEAGQIDGAIDFVYGDEYSTAIAKTNTLKEEFLESIDQRSKEEVNRLERSANSLLFAMVAALFAVGVLQVTNLVLTRKRVLAPVIAVKDQMGEIAVGNLSADFALESDTSEIGRLIESIHETKGELKKIIQDIDHKLAEMARGNMDLSIGNDYRGEFQPIQRAMKQILDAFNEALSQINRTAEQVTMESQQVAAGAQILSRGTVDQASAVEELTQGIQQLSEQVDSTSSDADHARTITIDAAAQLELCNAKMKELTASMENISQSSHEIGGIIKTIEDISFQTNILALNAAVEAARAGDRGKGFAVVADEVQSLANKSAASAKNITLLIEESVHLVEQGTALSIDTTEALAVGVSGARQSTELVERIADSAIQQVEALRQLRLGMEQISNVVQTNASTAEKSATSAEELHGQAEELKVSVQRFRLRDYR
ncbi:MAG: methyl-accepting chemotaxis protein [Dorea sp.]|nr:methyl-accepting chemotaxis protein [Dorea sp.]